MRRIAAAVVLATGVVAASSVPVRGQESESAQAVLPESRTDQTTLPDAIDLKGGRPRVDPTTPDPAATNLSDSVGDLSGPPTLSLPNQPEQVRIKELRPLTLEEVLQIAEVNSPTLKAVVKQEEQAKSSLRAAISAWYPTLDLSANGLPEYFKSYTYRNPKYVPQPTPFEVLETSRETYGRQWRVSANLRLSWDIINPARVPQIAAARDSYERVRHAYIVALRDLRLETATAYFRLQESDEGVRIGQDSVRASLISLRDARARYNAGVNTKLEVLEAETQLARDKRLLTDRLTTQQLTRRNLARLMNLPQDVTPTAATPARPLGLWGSSLQESITAAYRFREELDQLILDVSIANSQANASLAAVQPVLSFINNSNTFRIEGQTGRYSYGDIDMDDYRWGVDNSTLLAATWRLFDGGRARAEYRRFKQAAEESEQNFAAQRDLIRLEVEQSFVSLRAAIQDIETTSSEVISSRESLRLSQLRVQAGVSAQREVVDNQRDLTNAEINYAGAIREYNVSLAELRRRTGLDALIGCPTPELPSQKPETGGIEMPIEPTPLNSACTAVTAEGQTGADSQPVQPLW